MGKNIPGKQRVDCQYIEKRTGHHRNTIQRWEDQGVFPKHHHLGSSKKRLWFLHEIDEWEAREMAKQNNSAAQAK